MGNRTIGKPVEILLVEDNPGDVRLTQEALKDSKISNNLHVVVDGEQALEFLQKEGKFANEISPDMVLLDLNIPKISGREVLEIIKQDPRTKAIPVVILTTSDADEDVFTTYELHANCYITKPVDFDKFMKVVRSIEQFWLTIVRLPKA